MKESKKIKVLIIIISICLLLILISFNLLIKLKESNSEEIPKEENTEQLSEEEQYELRMKPEGNRIESYVGRYFKYIEQEKYEEAYKLLYSEFRNENFGNVEEYKEYIEKEKYPELIGIEFKTITLRGDLYIIKVGIKDMLNVNDTGKEKKFIIKENGYNDFYISFDI